MRTDYYGNVFDDAGNYITTDYYASDAWAAGKAANDALQAAVEARRNADDAGVVSPELDQAEANAMLSYIAATSASNSHDAVRAANQGVDYATVATSVASSNPLIAPVAAPIPEKITVTADIPDPHNTTVLPVAPATCACPGGGAGELDDGVCKGCAPPILDYRETPMPLPMPTIPAIAWQKRATPYAFHLRLYMVQPDQIGTGLVTDKIYPGLQSIAELLADPLGSELDARAFGSMDELRQWAGSHNEQIARVSSDTEVLAILRGEKPLPSPDSTASMLQSLIPFIPIVLALRKHR